MKTSFALLLTAALTFVSKSMAAVDPNFHIYLALGQSNMEGQAPIAEEDRPVEPRFQMLATVDDCKNRRLGQWYDATSPLANCDGQVGLLETFGRSMVANLPEEVKVGVAVVAIAGCDIQLFEEDGYESYSAQAPDWMATRIASYGGNPFQRLVDMGKKAQESGVIKGILFHQGETNNGQADWPDRVKDVYERLLAALDLKAENVPLLAGEVVTKEVGGICADHNAVIQRLPEVIPTAHVISAEGLPAQDDNLHFSTQGYRTFGDRYAQTMLSLLKTDDADVCWSEALGYPCCSSRKTVLYTDDDGEWGVENGDWCGLKNNYTEEGCWAEKAGGYACCSTDKCRKVVYTDYDGQWDYDFDAKDWCGITSENTIC